MTINLTDPANHPVNSPLTDERIECVIEALESSLQYRNGSSQDHFIADAVKGLRELRESREAADSKRETVRREHAEWSQVTFGNVGPVGPLKHLAKEALEAAAEPNDLSEWADMQFLLWDAQRRAGIPDGEITAAMEEKLKVNMQREWPEPKDGEPRLHTKAAPQEVG